MTFSMCLVAKSRGRYQFHTLWELDASPGDVFTALAQLLDYPAWWRQVRSATRVDHDNCNLTIRSVLPYDLTFVSRRSRSEAANGILEATLTGDLEGMSRWTITEASTGTVAVFDEDVIAHKALIRRLGPIARPAFRANHTVMMNQGKRGLVAYLAGMSLGRSLPPNH